ncbi:hypothetical protein HDV62DRAFT_376357 [Trichoderma sp. SZMC 28011]
MKLFALFWLLPVAMASTRGHQSPTIPTIEGPITGGTHGHPFSAYVGDISDIGYVEEEYFISGQALRYNVTGNLTIDGKWTLVPIDPANYKTRILIRRPAKESDFNGDAILEWINVSAGYDLMISDGPGVYDAGYAFVGVSAQIVGIVGYQNVTGMAPLGLTEWDPERYGSLNVPDDRYSYDIYTQAANLLKSGLIPGLKAKNVIGTGESQSGIRLNAYANGVQPISNAFDALIPVISFGQASDFSRLIGAPYTGTTALAPAVPTRIRTDLKIPVHQINTESEALYVYVQGCRQPDTTLYRYWENTGGAHANLLVLQRTAALAISDQLPNTIPVNSATADPVSWLPPLDAAYRHASRWIRTGIPPPTFPLMEIGPSADMPLGVDYIRDSYNNTKGGARQPEITVPIAAYNGTFIGVRTNFSDATLKSLYPTNKDYVTKMKVASSAAVKKGLILGYQATNLVNAAINANVPPS